MGRQICFYATQKDVDLLIREMQRNGGIVIGYDGEELSKEHLSCIADYGFCENHFGGNRFLVTKNSFPLSHSVLEGEGEINPVESTVIEFALCTPHPPKTIDLSLVENNFRRDGFIVIDDSDEYHRQMSELMKNPTYIDNPNYIQNGFEHGRLWYSPKFFDSDGKNCSKSKELDGLYNGMRRFIKRNFKQTKDKFAYIGPDAYAKYKEGAFIPCSGRNRIDVE